MWLLVKRPQTRDRTGVSGRLRGDQRCHPERQGDPETDHGRTEYQTDGIQRLANTGWDSDLHVVVLVALRGRRLSGYCLVGAIFAPFLLPLFLFGCKSKCTSKNL